MNSTLNIPKKSGALVFVVLKTWQRRTENGATFLFQVYVSKNIQLSATEVKYSYALKCLSQITNHQIIK